MIRYRRWLSGLSLAAAVLFLPYDANAATIETYLIRQGGWINTGTNTPDSTAELQATFTGTVDPVTGFIRLPDLTDFVMIYSLSPAGGGIGLQLLNDLQFFSFNARTFDTDPASAALSLNIDSSHNDGVSTFDECVGFSAQFSVTCLGNFPAGVKGVVQSPVRNVFTLQLPTLTRLSRTEVPDPNLDPTPTPTPVPEPGTLFLIGSGASALIVKSRRTRDRRIRG